MSNRYNFQITGQITAKNSIAAKELLLRVMTLLKEIGDQNLIYFKGFDMDRGEWIEDQSY